MEKESNFFEKNPLERGFSFPWFSDKIRNAQEWVFKKALLKASEDIFEISAQGFFVSLAATFVGISTNSELFVGASAIGVITFFSTGFVSGMLKFPKDLESMYEITADGLEGEDFYLTDPGTGKPNPEAYLFD